MLATGYFADT